MFTLRKTSQKHPFFSLFPKLGGTFLPKLILTLFLGGENKMKKIAQIAHSQGGVIWSFGPNERKFFSGKLTLWFMLWTLMLMLGVFFLLWSLFYFRLFVFMTFCNCTTYCKVRIKISGFLTGGRSGGFLYSRQFLGLAIKCLLHCIDWAAVEMCQR